MRLNKFLSHHGICSRRDADGVIAAGRVKINGVIQNTPYIVQEDDIVHVDEKELKGMPKSKVWIYYKPLDIITTHKDEKGRETVFDQPNIVALGHVVSVGRLDINSEGLLLITNDPTFAHNMEHPKNKIKRVYKVRVFGDLDPQALDDLSNGITIEGIHYDPIHVEYDIKQTNNHWLLMTLTEGKNREIRHVLGYLGLQVNRLIRIAYGEYSLGDMNPGDLKRV